MNDRTILGTVDDPRIRQCGIRMTTGEWIDVVPFIEAAQDFSGSFAIDIAKTSKSGRSKSRQGNRIGGGLSALSRIRLDQPARIEIRMRVTDESGKLVCQLAETINVPQEPQKL